MRVRRHTRRPRPEPEELDRLDAAGPAEPLGPPDGPRDPEPARFRRWRPVAWVATAAVLGYILSVVWLAPGPVLASDRVVARVLGLTQQEAERRLTEQGFRPRLEAREAHPTAPAGSVIWQSPAPEIELPEGTVVRLTVSAGPAAAPLPDVVGLGGPLARRVLDAAGFRVGVTDSIASLNERGVVVATRPSAGVARMPGSSVTLVVSSGPPNTGVPSLLGLNRSQAREALEGMGLRVGNVTVRSMPGVRDGVVINQTPKPGTLIPQEGRVHLTFSRAERP